VLWGENTPDKLVELALPPAELRRIFITQRDRIVIHQEATWRDREAIEAESDLDTEALAACESVLRQISNHYG
jgi:hypothetical protein